MSDQPPATLKRKRRPPLGKRELAMKTTSTNLWIADEQLLKEVARSRGVSTAELLRDIARDWALRYKRQSERETLPETRIIETQRRTTTAIDHLSTELSGLLGALLDAVTKLQKAAHSSGISPSNESS